MEEDFFHFNLIYDSKMTALEILFKVWQEIWVVVEGRNLALTLYNH